MTAPLIALAIVALIIAIGIIIHVKASNDDANPPKWL